MSFPIRPFASLALSTLILSSPVRAELVPMKPKRVFLASSSEEVVASGGKDLFREGIVLKGRPGCLVVRFGGELLATDGPIGDDGVVVSFDVTVGDLYAVAPVFHEGPLGTQPRLVSLSGHLCDLPAGSHEVSVKVRTEGPGDEVTVGPRTLEIWAESGRVPPSTISLVPAD